MLRQLLGTSSVFFVFPLLTMGCQEEALPGHEYRIEATGLENGCTDAPANLSERFTYRVVVDGSNVELAVGPDVFATGFMDGCVLTYESVVWEERYSGGEISWQLYGDAVVEIPGSDCGDPDELAGGLDWGGSETFILKSSTEEAEMSPGCEYTSTLAGTLQRNKNG